MPEPSAAPLDQELVIEARPATRRAWAADLWRNREVFAMLARKDFQTRYKRASFGVLWAVAVPLLQGLVMAVVFSRIVRLGGGSDYGAYVFSGVIAFSYFSGTLSAGSTAIVDAAGLTDKVWFPRVLLAMVPVAANLVGLLTSLVVLVVILPLLGGELGPGLLLLVPATVLLTTFTAAINLVASALYVYYRDVKFLVQAALLVWLYVTPIIYTKELLGDLASWIDLNPMTGIVAVVRRAVLGGDEALLRPVGFTLIATVVLSIIGLEAQRRHDRLFVDQL